MLAEHLAGHTTRMHRKRSLRQDLRRRLEVNVGDSSSVVHEVGEYLKEKPALAVVAVYSALPGEVDLSSLPEVVDRVWAFPKVVGNELVFHQIQNTANDLVIGAYGILEPKSGTKEIEITKIDLFLCPGLGFDHRGARIGRGRGFYDRALANARPDAVKLGVCFGFQLVENIEMEEHDIRMNGVIAG